MKFGAGLHGWGWGPGCRGPAEETVWGWLSLPQQALETALMSQPWEAPPLLGPSVSPTFSGKAEAASAPIHRDPGPSASQQQPSLPRSEKPHLTSRWVLHSSPSIAFFAFPLSLVLVSLPFSVPLAQSGPFSRIPLHLDLFKSRIQLVFSSFSGIWKL